MLAFAANSLLARLALIDPANDPAAFTSVRLLAGGLALLPVYLKVFRRLPTGPAAWWAPVALASYAIFFSLAYVRLSAGAGALIAFSSVQLSMMVTALARGGRLNALESTGFALALGGMVYLLLPGAQTPPLVPALMMAAAGASWGAYTLLGAGAADPVGQTARNFVWAAPLALLFALGGLELTPAGWGWALLSGAVTSGLGYVLWYRALVHLDTVTAAIVQLSVPAIAALGGVAFLDETLTPRLVLASAVILGGIYLKVAGSRRR